jgi:hypothetical protein
MEVGEEHKVQWEVMRIYVGEGTADRRCELISQWMEAESEWFRGETHHHYRLGGNGINKHRRRLITSRGPPLGSRP